MKFIALPASGELVDSDKKKFWRWEQKKNNTLVTASGNVGSEGRESSKKFPSKDKIEREIESKHYAKLKSGFSQLPDKADLPILWQTWLTDS